MYTSIMYINECWCACACGVVRVSIERSVSEYYNIHACLAVAYICNNVRPFASQSVCTCNNNMDIFERAQKKAQTHTYAHDTAVGVEERKDSVEKIGSSG